MFLKFIPRKFYLCMYMLLFMQYLLLMLVIYVYIYFNNFININSVLCKLTKFSNCNKWLFG